MACLPLLSLSGSYLTPLPRGGRQRPYKLGRFPAKTGAGLLHLQRAFPTPGVRLQRGAVITVKGVRVLPFFLLLPAHLPSLTDQTGLVYSSSPLRALQRAVNTAFEINLFVKLHTATSQQQTNLNPWHWVLHRSACSAVFPKS